MYYIYIYLKSLILHITCYTLIKTSKLICNRERIMYYVLYRVLL